MTHDKHGDVAPFYTVSLAIDRPAQPVPTIEEVLAFVRQIRPAYPSIATLADVAACVPEGTPTRAVLDAWLHARRHGAVNPVIYLGVDAWEGMRADAREGIGALVTLVRSTLVPPDEVVWVLVWIPEAERPIFRVTRRDEP